MNKKIVIDAGHGGNDPGAVGNGITEKDYTLKISQYMANRLRDLGADVTLTRNTDETLDPTDRVNRVLNAYGDSKDVVVISNHINAGGGDGAEVIYALRGTDKLPNLILTNLEERGQNIRKAYTRALPSNPSKDYYFMLRNTGNTDAYIVEYGFLDSTKDDVAKLKNNWQEYAEAVVESLAQYLNIPYSTGETGTYVVKSGDTLWSIAKKYNTTVNEIKDLNNLSTNLLTIGMNLQVPSIQTSVYTVKSGDTLYSIAKKYNLSVDELKALNNFTNNLLSIGQQLTVTSNNKKNYTVKPGDTLYSIANNNNLTVESLKKANNLTSNLLSIGQQLIIP